MKTLKQLIFAILIVGCSSETNNGDSDDSDLGTIDSAHEWKEPENHREIPMACAPRERVSGTSENCNDEDCTNGDQGRCRLLIGFENSIEGCTYDACKADTDCDENEVCECGDPKDLLIEGPGADESRCVPSNCKSDDDCGSGFCKASPDICVSGKISGYFCTSQLDECLEDSECGPGVCTYIAERSIFLCAGDDCG